MDTEITPEQTEDSPSENPPEVKSSDASTRKVKRAPSHARLPDEEFAFAKRMIRGLGEENQHPKRMIMRLVQLCGVEIVEQLYLETLEIEANGGMMLPDGSRRRTPGGVFFRLAQDRIHPKARAIVFGYTTQQRKAHRQRKAAQRRATQPPPSPPKVRLKWDDWVEMMGAVLASQGVLEDVRITLIGRPGAIEIRQNLVMISMTDMEGLPTIPAMMPPFPEQRLTYIIYISIKNWQKVEQALEKENDKLIVEGLPAFDPNFGQFVVYTTNVTTKYLQVKEKKQAKAAAAKEAKQQAETPALADDTALPQEPYSLPPEPAPILPDPLEILRQQEAEILAKVNAINALPFTKRKGLVEAMRQLQQIREQIQEMGG